MKQCPACKTKIGDGFSHCPICNLKQTDYNPKARIYPPQKNRFTLFHARSLCVLILWILTLASCIVNLSLGGTPWSLYAVLGAICAHVLFLSVETAEDSLLRRIATGGVALCLLLYGICRITDSGTWATAYVIPLVLFAALLATASLYFFAHTRYGGQFLPMLFLCLLSFAGFYLGIRGILPLYWPLITFSASGFSIFILVFIFYRKQLFLSILKKFQL